MRGSTAFSFTGFATSLAAATPLCFVVGLGGSLLCIAAGTCCASVVRALMLQAQWNRFEASQGEEQLEGVLDSSQLDGQPTLDPADFRASGTTFACVAAALVGALVMAAIVSAATGGVGINFSVERPHLSDFPRLKEWLRALRDRLLSLSAATAL